MKEGGLGYWAGLMQLPDRSKALSGSFIKNMDFLLGDSGFKVVSVQSSNIIQPIRLY